MKLVKVSNMGNFKVKEWESILVRDEIMVKVGLGWGKELDLNQLRGRVGIWIKVVQIKI